MATSLPAKLGIKPDGRLALIGAPSEVAGALGTEGARFSTRLSGSFDHIHAFFTSQKALDAKFDSLKKHLREGAALWVSWPKAKQLQTDLDLKVIIAIGYRHGLVESKTIGIDATWSAIKFTHPKKGKRYNNSYGQLPEDT